jgi:hypothetical protein
LRAGGFFFLLSSTGVRSGASTSSSMSRTSAGTRTGLVPGLSIRSVHGPSGDGAMIQRRASAGGIGSGSGAFPFAPLPEAIGAFAGEAAGGVCAEPAPGVNIMSAALPANVNDASRESLERMVFLCPLRGRAATLSLPLRGRPP